MFISIQNYFKAIFLRNIRYYKSFETESNHHSVNKLVESLLTHCSLNRMPTVLFNNAQNLLFGIASV